MIARTEVMRRFLWQVGGQDPRYRNFIQAQGIDVEFQAQKRTLLDTLLARHSERIQSYEYFLDLYFGNHWFNVSEENVDPMKVNYCKITVNKNTAFLMNKGFKVTSQFPEIESFLQHNWQLNNGGKVNNLWGINASIQGSITGDLFIALLQDTHELTGQQYYNYEILESSKSFPVVSRNKVQGFLYYGNEEFVRNENNGFPDYDTRYEGYYYRPGKRTRIVEETPTTSIDYAFLDLPIVHIPNFPNPISMYGLSDLHDIYQLNMTYDKLITTVQDVIDYNAEPITILKGASATELTRGSNRIWTIPRDADLSNLKLEGELTATVSQIARLRENIAEESNVPENSVGKQQPISNTSAAALAITFMPLYETMEFKRVTYGLGILKLNALTVKLAILQGKLDVNKIIQNALKRWETLFADETPEEREKYYPFREKVDPNIDYNSLEAYFGNLIPPEIIQTTIEWLPPLPRDEKMNTDLAIANVTSKFWSIAYARKKLGMTETESKVMEKDIIEEISKYPEKFQSSTVMSNEKIVKTGMEGDQDVKGRNESIRVQNNAEQQ